MKKVAIVYDRVNKWGGAERVLLTLHEMFPNAPLYTSVYDSKNAKWAKVFLEIKTSFLQKIPFLRNRHELIPFLMPLAFWTLDLNDFDLVISVTSEFAKGIRVKGKHVCYCLTPTRYLWSGYNEYFKNPALKFISLPVVYLLRKWDKKTAKYPDKIIAISTEVRKRIRKYYKRDSEIIFPPVDISQFRSVKKFENLRISTSSPDLSNFSLPREYHLVVSRLVPYKKVDLVIKAFNKLEKNLVIVGTGSEEKKLKAMANKNIKFVGQLTDGELLNYYRRAKALVFAQDEDFGLVAVEAQLQGKPVIAYKSGGAIDIIKEAKTGVFFKHQTEKDLIEAIEKFEKTRFNSKVIVQNAKRFSEKNFKDKFTKTIGKSGW